MSNKSSSFLSVDAVLARTNNKWVITDEIPVGITLLTGPQDAGKSLLALDYAFRVAPDQTVVYVAGEDEDEYPERCEAWLRHYPRDGGRLYFNFDKLEILNTNSVEAFVNGAATLQPGLIIIDPVHACLGTGDINVVTIGAFANACLNLKRLTGASILLVEHTDTGGFSLEVRNILTAYCDAVLVLEPSPDDKVLLMATKTAHNSEFQPRYLTIESVEWPGGRSSAVLNRSPKRFRIAKNLDQKDVRILKKLNENAEAGGEGEAHNQLSEKTGVSLKSTYRIVDKLQDIDYVFQPGHGATIQITPQGKAAVSLIEKQNQDTDH